MYHFLRKVVLYSFTKFGILESCTNIEWLSRFDLVFDRLQNSALRRNFGGSFQVCLVFPEKLFCICWRISIFEPFVNIQLPKRFDLGFLEILKQAYRNSNIGKKYLESFKVCLIFPEKRFCIHSTIWHFRALYQYSVSQKNWFRTSTDFKISW